MATRIRWTKQEQETVLRRVAALMETGAFERGEFARLIQRAQHILPEHRRRPFAAGRIGPDLHDLEQRTIDYRKALLGSAPSEAPVLPQQAPTPDDTLTAAVRTVAGLIADAVYERLRPEFEQLKQPVKDAPAQSVAVTTPAPIDKQPAKPPLPRIFIVGPLPGQQEILRRDYQGMADLTFSRENFRHLDPGQTDVIIGMTKFMQHPQEKIIRTCSVPYRRVAGGLSSLRQEIDTWLLSRENN